MDILNSDSAFPYRDDGVGTTCLGLSKRELFAALAMQGILARGEPKQDIETLADVAVDYADSLVDALNVERKP